MLYWYLVYTKPRQELSALQNLERQGYHCYLPVLPREKLMHGDLRVKNQPLFPRYLFIRLGLSASSPSWAPVRSTIGVSRLVSFGVEPAKVDDKLINLLQAQEVSAQREPQRLFEPGERVRLTEGAFAGIEGIYQVASSERRVMVLIELLSKPVSISVAPVNLQKID
jgi:transcriptional antiterminator RfaH